MTARLLLVGVLTGMLGCPGPRPDGDDGGVDSGIALSPVEMCDRLAGARCELLKRCFPAFLREAPSSCRSIEQTRCFAEYEALRPSFDGKLVEVSSERVLACEDRMRNSTCPPTFPPGYPSGPVRPYADCELSTGLLTGKVPTGQSCEHAVECAPGLICVKVGGVCRGVCSPWPALGDPCAFGCAPGLVCDAQGTQDPTDDRCAAPRGANAPCQSSQDCASDLYCAQGTCRPRGKLGEACVFDPQRLSTCDPGLACDVTPYVSSQLGVCVLPKETGQPCRFHWTCAPGLLCLDLDWRSFPQTAPAPGECMRPLPAGSNCPFTPYASYVGEQCEPGSYCGRSTQTCRPLPALGQPCDPTLSKCSGLGVYCRPTGPDTGVCVTAAGLNDTCAVRVDAQRVLQVPCTSGYCDAQVTLTCLPPTKPLNQECASNGECLSGRCAVQQDRVLRCAAPCH